MRGTYKSKSNSKVGGRSKSGHRQDEDQDRVCGRIPEECLPNAVGVEKTMCLGDFTRSRQCVRESRWMTLAGVAESQGKVGRQAKVHREVRKWLKAPGVCGRGCIACNRG
jgi:hypothetical protein